MSERAHPTKPTPSARPTRQQRDGGRPLPSTLRDTMQSRFAADFGSVRVHDDAHAREDAAALNARAFTVGESITLGAKAPPLDTQAGAKLIAHELAHVVQQRRGGLPPLLSADAPHEQAADRAAQAAVHGTDAPIAVGAGTAVGIARQPEDDDPKPEAERRKRDKQRTQQRKQDRGRAGKDEQQIADQRARAERRKLEQDAGKAGAKSRSDQRKLDALKRFDNVQKDINEPQVRKNQRKGAFDEAQRTPSDPTAKPQEKFVAGGSQLPDQDLRPGQDRYAQPDYSKPKSGTGGAQRINLKSDRVDTMKPGQARAAAKRYTAQAMRNMAQLPAGDTIVVRYAHTPSPEVKRVILAEHFKQGSPISEVQFGTESVKNPAFGSGSSAPTPTATPTPKASSTPAPKASSTPAPAPAPAPKASSTPAPAPAPKATSTPAPAPKASPSTAVGKSAARSSLSAGDRQLLKGLDSRSRASARFNARLGTYVKVVGGLLSVVGVADSISDAMTVYRHGTLLPEARDAAGQVRTHAEQARLAADEEDNEFFMFGFAPIIERAYADRDRDTLNDIVESAERYQQQLQLVMDDMETVQVDLAGRSQALHKIADLFKLAAKLPRYETGSLFSQYMMADALDNIGNTLGAAADEYAAARAMLGALKARVAAVSNSAYDTVWDLTYEDIIKAQRLIDQQNATKSSAAGPAMMRPPMPPPMPSVIPLPGTMAFPPWYYPK